MLRQYTKAKIISLNKTLIMKAHYMVCGTPVEGH